MAPSRLLVLLLPLLATTARADVYSWTDDDGVVHFTNVPTDHRARLHPVPGRTNTFAWGDDLGAMRRMHRVDVDTYDHLISSAAHYYSLPPALVKAIIAAESAFEPTAVSKAGAMGLMQLMPKTAAEVHCHAPHDPKANIYGGTRYLRLMANRFNGDIRLTAAAYNAGPEAVAKVGRVPRIEETETYVKRVLRLYRYYLEHWQPPAP